MVTDDPKIDPLATMKNLMGLLRFQNQLLAVLCARLGGDVIVSPDDLAKHRVRFEETGLGNWRVVAKLVLARGDDESSHSP